LQQTVRAGAAKSGAVTPRTEPHGAEDDADLARLVKAWPGLAADVKAAILALAGLPR